MKIRLERKKDYFEVENLTREAFWNVYRPGCFEHLVIHKLRDDEAFVKELDYVIEEDSKLVANIVYAKGNIKLEDGSIKDALIFGPVSVLPEYQKKGYAKKLINYTLELASKMGYPFVLITGNPDYYKKYGFESASKYEIYYEGMNKEDESPFFMIKVLNDKKLVKGVYSDPEVYNIDENELEEFDKQFPTKVKEKREGQLV